MFQPWATKSGGSEDGRSRNDSASNPSSHRSQDIERSPTLCRRCEQANNGRYWNWRPNKEEVKMRNNLNLKGQTMNTVALTLRQSALTLYKTLIYQTLKSLVTVNPYCYLSFNINSLCALTPKKGALISLDNKNGRTNLLASLKINPVMFVMQSLCVAAFMLGLFAAVIIAAAFMGVL